MEHLKSSKTDNKHFIDNFTVTNLKILLKIYENHGPIPR